MIRKKILLLGDFSVGKTSLVRRYVDGSFDDKYLTTIGVKISKKLFVIDAVEYEMFIWDIEGATPSRKMSLSYYKGASGAIFVGDTSRKETLESIEEHKKVFLEENPDAKIVIAYNKSDKLNEEEKKAFNLNDDTFLTSAKDDNNVEKLFTFLMKKLIA